MSAAFYEVASQAPSGILSHRLRSARTIRADGLPAAFAPTSLSCQHLLPAAALRSRRGGRAAAGKKCFSGRRRAARSTASAVVLALADYMVSNDKDKLPGRLQGRYASPAR